MKKALLALLLVFFSHFSFAQPKTEKTILFLIPFFSDRIDEIDLLRITTDDDIYAITLFQLVAFWEGAQIALDEFSSDDIQLTVVVKDITDNETKLKSILEDHSLMEKVDLMIGPFFGNMFELAASYALKYEIPIVNPFGSKRNFLKDNEFAYKLMPAADAAPRLIVNQIKDDTSINILLWAEDDYQEDIEMYEKFFTQQNTPFSKIKFESGISNLTTQLKENHNNIVVVSAKSQAKIIHNFRLLQSSANFPEYTIIVPEIWLAKNQSEIETFNELKTCFFSNYFVDYNDEKTIYFISEFIERYASPPDISRFSFQGYDVVKYFLNCLVHNFDTSKFTFKPLSLGFDFLKLENGGYENQKKRLLRLQDYTIIEVEQIHE